jgi:acyl-CoA thioesterase FadM
LFGTPFWAIMEPMKNPLWTERYTVNTLLLDPGRCLGLVGLLNLIQNAAWIHATHLGHGYEEMIRDRHAWVLTRQKVVMDRWPVWGEEVELRTWLRPGAGLLAIRDFEICQAGTPVGGSSTQWLILDLDTRRPAEKWPDGDAAAFRTDAPVTVNAGKLRPPAGLQEWAQFPVRNSDHDLNGHVNNTRYGSPEVRAYEVNFLNETLAGDVVAVAGAQTTADRFEFQGIRTRDRRALFAAALTVRA